MLGRVFTCRISKVSWWTDATHLVAGHPALRVPATGVPHQAGVDASAVHALLVPLAVAVGATVGSAATPDHVTLEALHAQTDGLVLAHLKGERILCKHFYHGIICKKKGKYQNCLPDTVSLVRNLLPDRDRRTGP